MKLLICSGIFPPESGGPATYSNTLADELSRRGHEVAVITYVDKKFKIHPPRRTKFKVFTVTRFRFKPWHYWKYYRAVKKYGQDDDVLYAQDPVSAGYPTMLANKSLRKPFVLKITGDYSWEQAMNRGLTDKLIDEFQTLNNYLGRTAKIREIQMRVCQAANKIIVPSEYLKRLVIGWGIDPNKITVIYNAIPKVANVSHEEARAELKIKPETFLVVSAGRPVKWKGFAVLEEVGLELQRQYPDINLRILTHSPHEEVLKYLTAADVFVLNSGYEGTSHTTLEAMALGTPVIITNVCGNSEIVKDGESGVLIGYNNRQQLRNAILTLYENPNLRKTLSQNTQVSLAKYSLENMTNSTERALTELASWYNL